MPKKMIFQQAFRLEGILNYSDLYGKTISNYERVFLFSMFGSITETCVEVFAAKCYYKIFKWFC